MTMADDDSFDLNMTDFSTDSFSFGECQSCTRKDEELAVLKKEQIANEANFKVLKQKIIATDQLLTQYRNKSLDCSDLEKQIEEWARKYEKSQREVTVLEAQLQKSLEDMEPIKRAKMEIELQVKNVQKEKEDLQTKLTDAEFRHKQYEIFISSMDSVESNKEEISADVKKKQTQLESKIRCQENRMSELKVLQKSAAEQRIQSAHGGKAHLGTG